MIANRRGRRREHSGRWASICLNLKPDVLGFQHCDSYRDRLGHKGHPADLLKADIAADAIGRRRYCPVAQLVRSEYASVMAFSNPQVYMDELVEPLCRRLEAEPTAYDLAIATCIILYHFADVVAHVRGGKAHEVADEIAAKVPGFHTVRAIANAGKHVELTWHPKSELIGLRAEHMVKGKGAAFSDGSYFAGNVTWSDIPEAVVVETPDGQLHDVPHLCARVFKDLCADAELFQV